MNCPACGAQNVDGAQRCTSCSQLLPVHQNTPAAFDVRVSRVAIASSICALIGIVFFLPGLIAAVDRTILRPQSSAIMIADNAALLATGTAFLLGVTSLFDIAISGGRRTGYGFGALGTIASMSLVFAMFVYPILTRVHNTASRITCGTNLSTIGKAMLIYANDYQDELPRAGGRSTQWTGRTPNWMVPDRRTAFGLANDGSGGEASVAASLYLLVKYAEVTPQSFVCASRDGTPPRFIRGTIEKGMSEFDPTAYGARDLHLIDLWDFGPSPWLHCSYSYHMPYAGYALTTSKEPGFAVAADRNPWIDSPSAKAGDFAKFMPDWPPFKGTAEQAKCGNTFRHDGDGQNVLFLDSHVEFARRAYCSIEDDNIYTISRSQTAGDPLGAPPKLGSQPANRKDSLLVNDPPLSGGQK